MSDPGDSRVINTEAIVNGEVLGILIKRGGDEFLVCTDERYPDIRVRDAAGDWVSIKGKRWGTAGAVAAEILGHDQGHTQTNIRTLAAEAIAHLVRSMFGGAWGG